MKNNRGWRNESRRHSLASRGIRTTVKDKPLARPPIGITLEEYHKIGLQQNISDRDLLNYAAFMRKRFPTEKSDSYAREWAERFRKGTEWAMGDGRSREILLGLDNNRYKPVLKSGSTFVFKEGHNILYPKYSKESARRDGRVVENRGRTAIVLIDGTAKEIPVGELELSAWQTERA